MMQAWFQNYQGKPGYQHCGIRRFILESGLPIA
ncbi:MAG: hypothetical protein ACI8Z0_001061, partial [Lentimonas sp.]